VKDQPLRIDRSTPRARARTPLLVMGGVIGLLVAWGLWAGADSRRHPRLDEENLKLRYIRCNLGPTPRALDAATAHLPDDTPVIGVVAGGQARAYVLDGFSQIDDHVLNDVVGGLACTVTYCPLSGCTRVFVDRQRGLPLSVAVGGYIDKMGDGTKKDTVMLLRVEESHYFHDTGEALEGEGTFPYPAAEFQETTWGQWRKAHPGTDVVVSARPMA
jgi:hypothetical protein